MRITRHRAIAAATAAAIALTAMTITPASARPYHHGRSAGNAAVLGAVAGVFGIIATLAARKQYEREYGYGYGGYGAYGPRPAPYGYYGAPRPYYRY
jgi:hypothetical protein